MRNGIEEKRTAFIGVDWADQLHAWHLVLEDGQHHSGYFKQQPQAIDQWVAQIRNQFPGCQLAVIVEQSKGALVAALLKYEDIQIFPINPGQLAKYRESRNYGRCKDDPTDAMLLAEFLMHYPTQLQALAPDSASTRMLMMLTQQRRRLVERRNSLANEMTAVLKQYYPLVIDLEAAKPYAQFLCKLLVKWPTLKRARTETIRNFFHQHNVRAKVELRLTMIADAQPLTNDEVLVECLSLRARELAKSILALWETISDYDRRIEQALQQHQDREVFASLPGAAKLTQARLIAAMGTDRNRFEDCQSFQASTGIAPVTRQSGKSRIVTHRWACTTFLKQTFHEFAGQSIGFSQWARAFYRMQLSRGKKPNVAKRALAYKWQRIIFRCWKQNTPYDETKYLERLKATGSPILEYMAQ